MVCVLRSMQLVCKDTFDKCSACLAQRVYEHAVGLQGQIEHKSSPACVYVYIHTLYVYMYVYTYIVCTHQYVYTYTVCMYTSAALQQQHQTLLPFPRLLNPNTFLSESLFSSQLSGVLPVVVAEVGKFAHHDVCHRRVCVYVCVCASCCSCRALQVYTPHRVTPLSTCGIVAIQIQTYTWRDLQPDRLAVCDTVAHVERIVKARSQGGKNLWPSLPRTLLQLLGFVSLYTHRRSRREDC